MYIQGIFPIHPIKYYTHVGRQVLPDLTKFMDSVHSKMMQAQGMLGKLEIEGGGAANEATKLP